jgi:NosR/NirI family transcriptional regulator, nitrous oxide reductase regulator
MRTPLSRWLSRVLCGLAWAVSACVQAGTLTRETLEQAYPEPLLVGERDAAMPVWPIFRRDVTHPEPELLGYVFETVDFTPEPGFSGKPINLMVTLDAQGGFLDVKLLSHSEPIFREGLGTDALRRFVAQYRGLPVSDSIRIVGDANEALRAGSSVKSVIGIARGTLSVRVIDKSIIGSAIKVARQKLGLSVGERGQAPATLRNDRFDQASWDDLVRQGLVTSARWTNRDLEEGFAGTPAAGRDPTLLAEPDALGLQLDVALLSLAQVGRNLLGEQGWSMVSSRLGPGELLVLVAGRGSQRFIDDQDVPAGEPQRLALSQGTLPLQLRHLIYDGPIQLPAGVARRDARLYRIVSHAGIDPAEPLRFSLQLPRSVGAVIKQRVSTHLPFELRVPDAWLIRAEPAGADWKGLWRARIVEIAVLMGALAILAVALLAQRPLARAGARLRWFRRLYLAFTLVFIGWYAQGQLSIVNLTAVIEAARQGRDLAFFLYDPMTVLLWGFVGLTLLFWGRGPFCGWLCPFGALQELASAIARPLGLRPKRLHTRVDARLKFVKYAVLAVIVVVAVFQPERTEAVIEVEPFKTAISLGFVRHWPYVLWAVVTIAAGLLVYRGYCRYLCPLGALMAVLGWLRRYDWLARRIECGKPCQTCRHRCDYQSIRPDGSIVYAECFQCLDCVAIHQSDTLCAPRIAKARGRRTIPIVNQAEQSREAPGGIREARR